MIEGVTDTLRAGLLSVELYCLIEISGVSFPITWVCVLYCVSLTARILS